MWKTLAVFCVVLLVVIYVEAGPGRKGKGQAAGQECSYTKGDWSVCTNNQMTRTLTLKADQPTTCEATKTVNRKCKAKAKKPKTVCKYDKKAPWSACTNGKMSRTLNLKQRKAGCEATKVETKDCK